ncbi:MAG: hypothetical protein DI547_12485 [Sphingobium sp.]|nr:MAG: hypothetical protein DI547_12485 [Sphingobium sp.]
MTFPDLVEPADRPVILVDGVPLEPGEPWSEYLDRAIAWMESEPRIDDAYTGHSLRRLLVSSFGYGSAIVMLLGAIAYSGQMF